MSGYELCDKCRTEGACAAMMRVFGVLGCGGHRISDATEPPPPTRSEPFWYLATPYSKYAGGAEAAFEQAAAAAASLVTHGIRVFCPIAHTHPIGVSIPAEQHTHDFWLAVDRPFMHAAVGLIVVKMKGWDESRGVAEEIDTFRALGKPILYMEWKD